MDDLTTARSFIVREAEPADAGAMASVHVASWRETYQNLMPDDVIATMADPDRRLRFWGRQLATIARSGPILVGEVGCEVLGIGTGHLDPDATEGEILLLYVLRRAQGIGLGGALVRHLAMGLADRGARSLMLWMLVGNPTDGFYRHMGGVPGATKRQQFGPHEIIEQCYRWPDIQILASR